MDFTRGEKIGLVGAMMADAGAFLPWARLGAFSFSGIDGDGVLTLILGIVLGTLIFFRPWDNKNKVISLILGLVILVVGGYDAFNIASKIPSVVGIKIGIGLYITILGGLIVLVSGLSGLLSEGSSSRKARSSSRGGGL